MRSTLVRALLLVALLLSTTTLVKANDPVSSMIISSAPGMQARPRTDGTTVVWIDGRSGDPRNSDVYAANIQDRREFPIATGAADQTMVDVADSIVVWQETVGACPPACDRNIQGVDLATGRQFDIAATTADESYPAIANNGVVWIEADPEAQKFRIKLRDLHTMAEPIIVGEVLAGVGIEQPVIYGDSNGWKVVWVESFGTGRNIRWRMRLFVYSFASPSV